MSLIDPCGRMQVGPQFKQFPLCSKTCDSGQLISSKCRLLDSETCHTCARAGFWAESAVTALSRSSHALTIWPMSDMAILRQLAAHWTQTNAAAQQERPADTIMTVNNDDLVLRRSDGMNFYLLDGVIVFPCRNCSSASRKSLQYWQFGSEQKCNSAGCLLSG
jgi:hypothetical protein